jgi:hypothetical protein
LRSPRAPLPAGRAPAPHPRRATLRRVAGRQLMVESEAILESSAQLPEIDDRAHEGNRVRGDRIRHVGCYVLRAPRREYPRHVLLLGHQIPKGTADRWWLVGVELLATTLSHHSLHVLESHADDRVDLHLDRVTVPRCSIETEPPEHAGGDIEREHIACALPEPELGEKHHRGGEVGRHEL